MTNRDRFELLILGVIWGAAFLFMRIAAPEFGAVALVEIRIAVAAVLLTAVLTWRNGLGGLRGTAATATTVGVLNSAFPMVLLTYATVFLTGGTVAVLVASAPLFGALVAYAWVNDKLTPTRILGLAVGFGGVLLLAWDKLGFHQAGGSMPAVFAGL